MTTPETPPPTALRQALQRIAAGASLSESEAEAALAEIMAGESSPAAVAGLLMGMRSRGESSSEIAGAVRALRAAMRVVPVLSAERLVDTCGTGGGATKTLNLSTAAAFVAAGAGVSVAKHGNRSFTSASGSADVLEALGISLELSAEASANVLATTGLTFLFAPAYHPAMRHLAQIRRDLGVPTLMNLVGPLANPAGAVRQVVGVAERERAPIVAAALVHLGSPHALVVHAEIGMDEISPVGATTVWEVRDATVMEWRLEPATLGLATPSLEGLEGAGPVENAARIEALLRQPASAPPALRAAVLLNAAAAAMVSGAGYDWPGAVAAATDALHNGAAAARLDALRRAEKR